MPLTRSLSKCAGVTRLRRRPRLLALESRLAPAVILGAVFHDVNGSGSHDLGEPGMPGVTVYLDANNNGKFDPPSGGTIGDPMAKTDSIGKYAIQTAAAGTFHVRQVVPPGFVQTTPDAPPLAINSNGTYTVPEFGNKQSGPAAGGVIHGHVFIDADGNGQQGNNEPGQGGVVVYIDANNNGKFDTPSPAAPGDPFTLSGNLGGYELKTNIDGKFTIGEVVPQGYVATTPILGPVQVAGGAATAGPDFGNKLALPPAGGVIHGTVFIDADGNGQQSNNEPGQPGVTVYLDLNGNGKFDVPVPGTNGEPAVKSGQGGGYEFKVGKNGEFVVAEVVPPGFTATTPTSGKVTVTGGTIVDGPDFGNKQAGQAGGLIRGLVFIDRNGNGKLDPPTPSQPGEPGLPGVVVFLDLNGNGKFDVPVPGTIGEPATLSGPHGGYEFKVGKDGDYLVREIVPHGLVPTTPTSGKVSVTGGQTANGPLFGLNKAPQTGGLVRGHVFVDLNGDGVRQNNEPGQPGVIVFADLNGNGKFDAPVPGTIGEPAVKSGLNGGYELRLKADGDYLFREVVPPGFTQTTPNPGKITVAGGGKVNGPDFGNHLDAPPMQFGAVAGRVFVDFNNNGKLDAAEPGMPGVRVYSDSNNNSKFDPGERFQFSNPLGFYLLTLPAGQHHVRQVVPTGFTQTAAPGPLVVAPNQIIPDAHFGNRPGGLAPFGSDFNLSAFDDDDPGVPVFAAPAAQVHFLGGIEV